VTQNKAEGKVNEVDDFITRLREGEIGIHPGAQKIQVNYGYSSLTKDIAQGLADAINHYEQHKSQESYEGCKKWINLAYTHSVILAGSSVQQIMKWKDDKIATLEQRILDLELEYEALNETHKKLLDENISLKGKYDECSDKYDKLVNAFSGLGKIDR
jgi:hypothetical protein